MYNKYTVCIVPYFFTYLYTGSYFIPTRSWCCVSRGSGGKNVIFSNCPYDQSKYSDPLIYPNMMSIKFCKKKNEWKGSIGGVKVDFFAFWDRKWAWFEDF